MRKGFAFLPIIAIAVIGLIAGSTALSALKEKPDSALYGLQRAAETSPANLFNYLSANYSAGLKEKRMAEVKGVLRSEGKEAATAFAKKEGLLGGDLEYEIASYVPLLDRTVRSMGTVLRLTTPENAPLGREFILLPNRTVRFGEEIVLEIRQGGKDIIKHERLFDGKDLAWERMNETAEYGGIRAVKLGGGLVAYDFNGTMAIAPAGDRICSRTMGLCARFNGEIGMLIISWLKEYRALEAYFVKNRSVIAYAKPMSGDVFAGYAIEYENLTADALRVRVSAEGPRGAEFIKVCGYADYAENRTACGAGLRALDISVSSNGKPVGGIYYLRIERNGGNVCLSDECIRVGGTKLLNNSLIALFSTDGRGWKNRSAFTRERDVEAYDVFHWNFENQTDRIAALLPEGNYSFMVDLDPCAGCRYGAEAHVILEADAGQGNASIDYSARQEYIGDLNLYVNTYGRTRYGSAVEAIRGAYGRFASLTGKIPESIRAFNIRGEFNPFSYVMLSKIKSGEARAYYVPEGYSAEDNRIEILPEGAESVCHELAHALYFENFKGSLGSEFEEGFAISICGIEKGAASFGDCMPGSIRERGIYTPHAVGRCVFEALESKGYITDGFWRRLLELPCSIFLDADLETEEGRNIWYYVLSKAAGRPVSEFPHTGERDYCAG